jgi:hypothetical protein
MRFACLTFIFSLFFSLGFAQKSISIKVISDPTYEASAFDSYRNDLAGILGNKAQINFGPGDIFLHNASATEILDKYDQFAAEPETDVIIVFGSYAAMQIMNKDYYPKPTLVFGVINHKLQGYSISPQGTSGVQNLAFLSHGSQKVEVAIFKDIYPYKNLAIITDWRIAEILKDSDYLRQVMDSIGSAYTIIRWIPRRA